MEDNDSASVDEVIGKFFDAAENGVSAGVSDGADSNADGVVAEGNRGSGVS